MRLCNSLFSRIEKSCVIVIIMVLMFVITQKEMIQAESICNNAEKKKYKWLTYRKLFNHTGNKRNTNLNNSEQILTYQKRKYCFNICIYSFFKMRSLMQVRVKKVAIHTLLVGMKIATTLLENNFVM